MPSYRDYRILEGGSQVYAVGGPFQYQNYGRTDIPDGDYFVGLQNRTEDGRTAFVLDRSGFTYIEDIRVRGTVYVPTEHDTNSMVVPKLCARIQDATNATLTSECYYMAVEVTDSQTPVAYVYLCKGYVGDFSLGDILDSSTLVIHNMPGLGDVPSFGLEFRVHTDGTDAVLEVYQAMVSKIGTGVYAESYNLVKSYTDSTALGPGGVGFGYKFTQEGVDATCTDLDTVYNTGEVISTTYSFDSEDVGKLLVITDSTDGNNGSYIINSVDGTSLTVVNLGEEDVYFRSSEIGLTAYMYHQGKACFDNLLFDSGFDF